MAQKLISFHFLNVFIVVDNIFQNEQKILKIEEMAFPQSWSVFVREICVFCYNSVFQSKTFQRTKFDVSQKPLIQKMHTEPEILNSGFGGVILIPTLRSTFM